MFPGPPKLTSLSFSNTVKLILLTNRCTKQIEIKYRCSKSSKLQQLMLRLLSVILGKELGQASLAVQVVHCLYNKLLQNRCWTLCSHLLLKAKVLFGSLSISKNRYMCRSSIKAKCCTVNFRKAEHTWSCIPVCLRGSYVLSLCLQYASSWSLSNPNQLPYLICLQMRITISCSRRIFICFGRRSFRLTLTKDYREIH